MIVADQADANRMSGRKLAELNNPYQEIRVRFAGDYSFIDVVPQQWFTITFAAGDTARGIVETDMRLLLDSYTITADPENGGEVVDAVFIPEAPGPAGVATVCESAGENVSSEQPASDPIAPPQGLVAFANVKRLDALAESWLAVSAETAAHGTVDPFWVQKAGAAQASQAIYHIAAPAEVQTVVEEAAATDRTPLTDPPNIWSNDPAPTAADLSYIQVESSPFVQGRHYTLGQWINGGGDYSFYLAKTDNDGAAWAWADPYEGETLPGEAKPVWLAINRDYVLLTVWDDTGGGRLALLVFDADLVFQESFDLGAAAVADVAARTWYAFPATVLDDADLWYVAGRMNGPPAPISLAGTRHIIRTEDAGAAWENIENGWGDDHCSALVVGSESSRQYWAMRG
jgi:hypothetical protein